MRFDEATTRSHLFDLSHPRFATRCASNKKKVNTLEHTQKAKKPLARADRAPSYDFSSRRSFHVVFIQEKLAAAQQHSAAQASAGTDQAQAI
jgi:hypothetical protein